MTAATVYEDVTIEAPGGQLRTFSGPAGSNGDRNRRRAALYDLAEYYAWSARRMPSPPLGYDPRTGKRWARWDTLALEIGRAQDIAAARVAYRFARAYPSPLPKETNQ